MRWSYTKSLFVLILLMTVFLGLKHWFREEDTTFSKISSGRQKSVILITVDTLRGDHLGYAGNNKIRSPLIDQMSLGMTVFPETYSNNPLTVPAHIAMFTSRFPSETNVHLNTHRLEDNFLTVTEVFQQNGYETAGFPVAVLRFQRGIEKGFSVFNNRMKSTDQADFVPRQKQRLMPKETTQKTRELKRIEDVITWIQGQQNKKKPFFLWLHVFEPHLAYHPPEPYRYVDFIKKKTTIDSTVQRLRSRWHWLNQTYTRNETEVSRQLYKNEVLWTEQLLKPLLRYLTTMQEESPFLMITSDHGECLNDSGRYFGHGHSVVLEELHVPCLAGMVSQPTGEATGSVNLSLVQSIDVAPTLLAAAGIQSPVDFRGKDILSDNLLNRMILFSCQKPVKQVGLLNQQCKIVWDIQNKTWKYWNRQLDPGEKKPFILKAVKNEKIKNLQNAVIDYHSSIDQFSRKKNPDVLEPEFREMLEKMGYIQ